MLTTLITLGILIPIFWFNLNASSLSTSIEIAFVYGDNTPITGLDVTLYNSEPLNPIETLSTDGFGKVLFAGLVDETYTWKWSWQGIAAQHSEQITCSQIVWSFKETLAYWTLEKTFVYESGVPVKGLEVTLVPEPLPLPPEPLTTGLTNADGYIEFGKLKAGNYTLEWLWGGKRKSETVIIGFADETPVVLTNYLELKSGGG